MHHVNEHPALEQRLPGIILKAHDHDLHAQALLRVADAVNEVTITRKQRNALDVGAEGVIYQVNGDCHVNLRLNFPFDLFFATAATLR